MFYLGRMGRSLPSPSAEGLRDTLARIYYPSSGMGLTHGPQLEERLRSLGGGAREGQEKEKKNLLWLGENNPEQRLLYCANINLGLLIILKV